MPDPINKTNYGEELRKSADKFEKEGKLNIDYNNISLPVTPNKVYKDMAQYGVNIDASSSVSELYDIRDKVADDTESWFTRRGRDIVRFGGKTLINFAGMSYEPIDVTLNIANGEAFKDVSVLWNSSAQRVIDNIGKDFSETWANHYSKESENAAWYTKWFPTATGSEKFWFNDMNDAASFVAGAALTEAAYSLLTAGTMGLGIGEQALATEGIVTKALRLAKNWNKAADLVDNADDVYSVFKNMYGGEALKLYKNGVLADKTLKFGRQFITNGWNEGAIQAREYYDQTESKLKTLLENGEITPEEFQAAIKDAKNMGTGIAAINALTVQASDVMALRSVYGFGSKSLASMWSGKGLQGLQESLGKMGGKEIGKRILTNSLPEGAEEFAQSFYNHTGEDYVLSKYDKNGFDKAHSIMQSAYNGLAQTVGSNEDMTGVLSGFFLGAIGMPNVGGIASNIKNRNTNESMWEGGIRGAFKEVADDRSRLSAAIDDYKKNSKESVLASLTSGITERTKKNVFTGMAIDKYVQNQTEAIASGDVFRANNESFKTLFEFVKNRTELGMEDEIQDMAKLGEKYSDAEFNQVFFDGRLDDKDIASKRAKLSESFKQTAKNIQDNISIANEVGKSEPIKEALAFNLSAQFNLDNRIVSMYNDITGNKLPAAEIHRILEQSSTFKKLKDVQAKLKNKANLGKIKNLESSKSSLQDKLDAEQKSLEDKLTINTSITETKLSDLNTYVSNLKSTNPAEHEQKSKSLADLIKAWETRKNLVTEYNDLVNNAVVRESFERKVEASKLEEAPMSEVKPVSKVEEVKQDIEEVAPVVEEKQPVKPAEKSANLTEEDNKTTVESTKVATENNQVAYHKKSIDMLDSDNNTEEVINAIKEDIEKDDKLTDVEKASLLKDLEIQLNSLKPKKVNESKNSEPTFVAKLKNLLENISILGESIVKQFNNIKFTEFDMDVDVEVNDYEKNWYDSNLQSIIDSLTMTDEEFAKTDARPRRLISSDYDRGGRQSFLNESRRKLKSYKQKEYGSKIYKLYIALVQKKERQFEKDNWSDEKEAAYKEAINFLNQEFEKLGLKIVYPEIGKHLDYYIDMQSIVSTETLSQDSIKHDTVHEVIKPALISTDGIVIQEAQVIASNINSQKPSTSFFNKYEEKIESSNNSESFREVILADNSLTWSEKSKLLKQINTKSDIVEGEESMIFQAFRKTGKVADSVINEMVKKTLKGEELTTEELSYLREKDIIQSYEEKLQVEFEKKSKQDEVNQAALRDEKLAKVNASDSLMELKEMKNNPEYADLLTEIATAFKLLFHKQKAVVDDVLDNKGDSIDDIKNYIEKKYGLSPDEFVKKYNLVSLKLPNYDLYNEYADNFRAIEALLTNKTPHYMSPESMLFVDKRSNTYRLGKINEANGTSLIEDLSYVVQPTDVIVAHVTTFDHDSKSGSKYSEGLKHYAEKDKTGKTIALAVGNKVIGYVKDEFFQTNDNIPFKVSSDKGWSLNPIFPIIAVGLKEDQRAELEHSIDLINSIENGSIITFNEGKLRFVSTTERMSVKELIELNHPQVKQIRVYQRVYDNKKIEFIPYRYEDGTWEAGRAISNVEDDIGKYANSVEITYENGDVQVINLNVSMTQEEENVDLFYKALAQSKKGKEFFATIDAEPVNKTLKYGIEKGRGYLEVTGESGTRTYIGSSKEEFDRIIKEFMDRTRDMSPIQKVGEVKQFLNDHMTSKYDKVYKLSFRYGADNMGKELADGKYDLPRLTSKSKIVNVNNDVVKQKEEDLKNAKTPKPLSKEEAKNLIFENNKEEINLNYLLENGFPNLKVVKSDNYTVVLPADRVHQEEGFIVFEKDKNGKLMSINDNNRLTDKKGVVNNTEVEGLIIPLLISEKEKYTGRKPFVIYANNFKESLEYFNKSFLSLADVFEIDITESDIKKANDMDNSKKETESFGKKGDVILFTGRLVKNDSSHKPEIFKGEKFLTMLNAGWDSYYFIRVSDGTIWFEMSPTDSNYTRNNKHVYIGNIGEKSDKAVEVIQAEETKVSQEVATLVSEDLLTVDFSGFNKEQLIDLNNKLKALFDSAEKSEKRKINAVKIKVEKAIVKSESKPKNQLATKDKQVISHKQASEIYTTYFPKSTLSQEDVTSVLGNLSFLPNSVVLGVYNGLVRLNHLGTSKSTPLFEGFRMVFNSLIRPAERTAIYEEAKVKYLGKLSKSERAAELKKFQENYTPKNAEGKYIYQGNELLNYYLETKVANEFINYKPTQSKSFITRFLNKLLEWVGLVKRGKAEQLFNRILNKEFVNFKTNSTESTVKTMLEITSELSDGSYITDLMGSEDSYRISNRIFSYMSREKLDFNEALDKVIDYYSNLVDVAYDIENNEVANNIQKIVDALDSTEELGQANIEQLKKETEVRMKLFATDPLNDPELDPDNQESNETDDSIRDSNSWNKALNEMGGEMSASKKFKEYLSTIMYKSDEFGLGVETDIPVDFIKAYGYMLRVCADKKRSEILPTLTVVATLDNELQAIVNQIYEDMENDPTVKHMIESNLERQLLKERMVFVDSEGTYKVIESNAEGIEKSQIARWSANIENLEITEEMIESSKKVLKESDNYKQIKNELAKYGFEFSDNYIKWCLSKSGIVSNSQLDKVGKATNLSSENNILFNKNYKNFFDSLSERLENRAKFEGIFPDSKVVLEGITYEGVAGRLMNIARGNSIFDNAIRSSSYKSPDNKTKYEIIMRTKIGDFANKLKNPEFMENYKKLREDKYKGSEERRLFINEIYELVNVEDQSFRNGESTAKLAMENYKQVFDAVADYMFESDLHFLTEDFELGFMGGFRTDLEKGTSFANATPTQKRQTLLGMWESGWYNPIVATGKSMQFMFKGNKEERLTEGTIDSTKNILFNWFIQETKRIQRIADNPESVDTIDKYAGKGNKYFVHKSFIDSLAGFGKKLNDRQAELTKEIEGLGSSYDKVNTKRLELLNNGMVEYKKSPEGLLGDLYNNFLGNEARYAAEILKGTELNKALKEQLFKFHNTLATNFEAQSMDDFNDNNIAIKKEWEDNNTFKEMYFDSFINSYSFYSTFAGDEAMLFKDYIDIFKRAGSNIAGGNTGEGQRNIVMQPMKSINHKAGMRTPKTPTDKDKNFDWELDVDADFYEAKGELYHRLRGEEVDSTDAASQQSVKAHLDFYITPNGKATTQIKEIHEKAMYGIELTYEDWEILDGNNAGMQIRKMVFGDSLTYLKLAVNTLLWQECSAFKPEIQVELDKLEKTQDKINYIESELAKGKKLWELRDAFPTRRDYFNTMIHMEKEGIDFIPHASASKMMQRMIKSKHFADLSNNLDSVTYLNPKWWKEQVATDGVKTKIVHGTQLMQLVWSEQNGGVSVEFKGSMKALNEMSSEYLEMLAQRINMEYANVREEMLINGDKPNMEALKASFINSLETSGATQQTIKFFKEANINLPHIGEQSESMLFSIASKAFSFKKPGAANALGSPKLYNVARAANDVTVGNKTYKFGDVIPTEVLRTAKLKEGIDYNVSRLRHGVPVYKPGMEDEGRKKFKEIIENLGNKTKVKELQAQHEEMVSHYYAEIILPANFEALKGMEIPANFAEGLGIRIPTQDKHSMLFFKVVDLLPAVKGASVIAPIEIVALSGADFDIDKLYMYFFGGYVNKAGEWVRYGDYINLEQLKEDYSHVSEEPFDKNSDLYKFMELRMKQNQTNSTEKRVASNKYELDNDMLYYESRFVHNVGNNDRALTSASMGIVKKSVQLIAMFTMFDKVKTFSKRSDFDTMEVDKLMEQAENFQGKQAYIELYGNHSPLDILKAYYNNDVGLKNIGIWAVSNVLLPALIKAGVAPYLKINETGDILLGKLRINDVVSSFLSSATDEAKEQHAAILGLSADNCSRLFDMMWRQGMHPMLGLAIINQEGTGFTGEYDKSNMESDIVTTVKAMRKNPVESKYIQMVEVASPEIVGMDSDVNIVRKEMTAEEKKENTVTQAELTAYLMRMDLPAKVVYVKTKFAEATRGKDYTFNLTQLVALNKGVRRTTMENMRFEESFDKLNDENKPFDGESVITGNPHLSTEYSVYKDVMANFANKFLLVANPKIKAVFKNILTGAGRVNNEFKTKLARDIVSAAVLSLIDDELITQYSQLEGTDNYLSSTINYIKSKLQRLDPTYLTKMLKSIKSKQSGEFEGKTAYFQQMNTFTKAIKFVDEKLMNDFQRYNNRPHALNEILEASTGKLPKQNLFTVQPIQTSDKKAVAKASVATKYIGFGEGISGSSTELYRNQAGKYANVGEYSSSDVVFVSIGGKRGNDVVRKEQQDKTIREALKAIESGATLITDNKAYVDKSDYNEGEKRLAKNLEAKNYNYSEETIDGQVIGVWSKEKRQNRNIQSLIDKIAAEDIDKLKGTFAKLLYIQTVIKDGLQFKAGSVAKVLTPDLFTAVSAKLDKLVDEGKLDELDNQFLVNFVKNFYLDNATQVPVKLSLQKTLDKDGIGYYLAPPMSEDEFNYYKNAGITFNEDGTMNPPLALNFTYYDKDENEQDVKKQDKAVLADEQLNQVINGVPVNIAYYKFYKPKGSKDITAFRNNKFVEQPWNFSTKRIEMSSKKRSDEGIREQPMLNTVNQLIEAKMTETKTDKTVSEPKTFESESIVEGYKAAVLAKVMEDLEYVTNKLESNLDEIIKYINENVYDKESAGKVQRKLCD